MKKEFGNCGKIVYVDGKPVGYGQFAPSEFLPNSMNYSLGASCGNAVIISCLYIADEKYRTMGLGNKLLNNIIEDLKSRGAKTVETFARKNNFESPSGHLDFYINRRFKIYRDDLEFQLLRLDL